jgi:adenylate kinase family enzyme
MEERKNPLYRILILGAPGSGKSTLANRVSKALSVEAVHLDMYYWKANWVETPSDEWEDKIDMLINQDCWVMDGNYIDSLSQRIKHATHILYLDIPWYKSIYRIILRMIKYRKKTRPDMNPDCKEKLNIYFIRFLLWSLNFNLTYKKKILNLLSNTEYKILYTNLAIDNWEEEISNSYKSQP